MYLQMDIKIYVHRHHRHCVMQAGQLPNSYTRGTPERSLEPYDRTTLNRPDVPSNIQQLMIVTGNAAFAQGHLYTGEIHVNTVAIRGDIAGQLLFTIKLEDAKSMPIAQADAIVDSILAADCDLPQVVRGSQASTLKGSMKSALERHSCCHGDYGLTMAEHQNPAVHKKALCILKEACRPLERAFPGLMLDIYKR